MAWIFCWKCSMFHLSEDSPSIHYLSPSFTNVLMSLLLLFLHSESSLCFSMQLNDFITISSDYLSCLLFSHGLSCTVSLSSALSLFSSSSSHLYCVSLQFSASVTISASAYSLCSFWCVCMCVCHSAKILLTCGSVCLPCGDCSFILALAAHGVYVSAKGILPGIGGDPPWSWILWHRKKLGAYFRLVYVWI